MRNWSAVAVFAVLSVVAAAGTVSAAAPDLDWHELYGDTLRDIGQWVETHSAYGYVASGFVGRETAGERDGFLMRLDDHGDTLWVKSYGDSLERALICVEETPDGGYILAGYAADVSGNADAYFVRTDAAGDTIWTSTVDYGGSELLYRVLQTPDMGFIAAGFGTAATSPGSTDVFAMKVNEDGKPEWKGFYMGLGHNRAYDMCAAGDGNYVLTGYTEVGTDEGDVMILKIDGANGDSLWAKTYGDTTRDVGRGIRQASDGGLVVVARKANYDEDWSRGFLLRMDASGDTLWTREYLDGPGHLSLYDIEITADQGYICAGYRDTTDVGDSDFYFLKTGPDGDVQWTKMIGKGEREAASCVTIADDLGYVAIGYSRELPGYDYNIYIMKLEGDDAGVDPVRAEVDPGLLVLEGSSPFTQEVGVRYEIPDAAGVNLSVFDVAGRHVATLVDAPRAAGSHTAAWDLTNSSGERMPSGVYFVRCSAGARAGTVKALVLR